MQSASLVLAHSDISTSPTDATASSTNGSWADRRATATWRVNMRDLVGAHIWDHHKGSYILRMNSFSHTGADFTTVPANQSIRVQIEGLPWKNSSYDVRTGQHTGKYDAFCLFMERSVARTYYLSHNVSKAQFSKSADIVDLKVTYIRMADGFQAVAAGTDPYPMCVLTFDIYPADA